MKARTESRPISRLLARASGKMNLPLTKMVKTISRTNLRGADEELKFYICGI